MDTLTIREIKAHRETFEAEMKTALERFTLNTGCIITYVNIDYEDNSTPPFYLKVEASVHIAP
ncbi:MAG: hypothetical protein ACREIQ_09315 [Nitrospiria bacterium]